LSTSNVVSFAGGTALLLLVAACAFVAVLRLGPPAAAPVETSEAEFSSGRAMHHLRIIARGPRPVGSQGHAEARAYIAQELTRLGLSPEVQTTPVVNNVVARLAGSGRSGKAILLVGHYDTVADSPGASDDGSAVAVILETLRALKAGGALNNDVIALFSDGEEAGLFGAKAFTHGHPWAKGVGLVLNFEARGSGGPAVMFETSGASGGLVRHLAAAAPRPVAYSLSDELYRLMPHDTDLSVFKAAGLPGLNFAFIKHGAAHYHGPLDNLENIDERSVQHQGTYALGLARHFGNLSLDNLREPDAVYFNLFGSKLVVYSERWVVPVAATAAALAAVAGLVGWRAKRLTLAGVGKGLAAVPLSVLVAVLGVALAGWLSGRLYGRAESAAAGDAAMLIQATAAVVAAFAFYCWCSRKVGGANLLFGGLAWWLALLLLTSLFWPGASYLFAWPLLPGLLSVALGLGATGAKVNAGGQLLLLALGALAGAALFAPVVYLTLMAFKPGSTAAVLGLALPAALVLVLLAPYLPQPGLARPRRALN
jgi:hypothetical protein